MPLQMTWTVFACQVCLLLPPPAVLAWYLVCVPCTHSIVRGGTDKSTGAEVNIHNVWQAHCLRAEGGSEDCSGHLVSRHAL